LEQIHVIHVNSVKRQYTYVYKYDYIKISGKLMPLDMQRWHRQTCWLDLDFIKATLSITWINKHHTKTWYQKTSHKRKINTWPKFTYFTKEGWKYVEITYFTLRKKRKKLERWFMPKIYPKSSPLDQRRRKVVTTMVWQGEKSSKDTDSMLYWVLFFNRKIYLKLDHAQYEQRPILEITKQMCGI